MKWLRWSTLAVSVVALCLVIGIVAAFRIDVEAAVQNQVGAVSAPIPSLEDASTSRKEAPPPSNETGEFQQLD
jgi:predicted anti-sigma-YlaC factor YlaD